jgi:hypothetical protein
MKSIEQIPLDFDQVFPISPCLSEVSEKSRLRSEREAVSASIPQPQYGVAISNHILRSALFGISESEAFKKETPIAAFDDISISIVSGQRPNQPHLDVWAECIRLSYQHGTGTPIRFSAYAMLKAIGRTNGGTDRKFLFDILADLASCLVRVKYRNGPSYYGTLISGWFENAVKTEYAIEINPRLATLYIDNAWTAISSEQRRLLKKQPLAQWLHAFYSSHSAPVAMNVATIRDLCGSGTKELFSFRQKLRKALKQVSAVSGWQCSINEKDKVVIEK